MCDWEYGLNKGKWDRSTTSDDIRDRLTSFRLCNQSPDTIAFNWCFFKNIALISEIFDGLGWNEDKHSQWTCINYWKKETMGKDFVYGTDLVSLLLKTLYLE